MFKLLLKKNLQEGFQGEIIQIEFMNFFFFF